jgi:hypothetical protein
VAFVGEDELSEPPRNPRWPSGQPAPPYDMARIADRGAAVPRRYAAPVAPSAPSALGGDPGDLVARALAILADEAEAWRNRRSANVPPRSVR